MHIPQLCRYLLLPQAQHSGGHPRSALRQVYSRLSQTFYRGMLPKHWRVAAFYYRVFTSGRSHATCRAASRDLPSSLVQHEACTSSWHNRGAYPHQLSSCAATLPFGLSCSWRTIVSNSYLGLLQVCPSLCRNREGSRAIPQVLHWSGSLT